MALKILVVDDDFINRKLLETMLKKQKELVRGVILAENGSEAINVLRDTPDIDLILLDIVMPVLDGKEFLNIFRADKENGKIPVIVLSTDDVQKGSVISLGAEDFIPKPISEKILLEKIRHWTKKEGK